MPSFRLHTHTPLLQFNNIRSLLSHQEFVQGTGGGRLYAVGFMEAISKAPNNFITIRKTRKRILTDLLAPWSRALLEKLTGSQLVKKFPIFYGTRKFITAFTSARHLSLSSARSIQSLPPHPTEYCPHIYAWVFQVASFPQVSPPKSCIHLPSPHTCYMPRSNHSSRFDHPNNIGWAVQIIKLLLL